MVQPNPDTALFCDWLLTSLYTRVTSARTALFNIIKSASQNQTLVTNLQWNDFIRATAYLYGAWLQYVELTNFPITSKNTFGANICQNGNFASDSVWTKGIGWCISGGKARLNSTGASDLYQSLPYILNHIYRHRFTITDYIRGGLMLYSPAFGGLAVCTANGIYEVYFIYSGPYYLLDFTGLGGQPSQLSLSDVSTIEIQFTP